MLLSSVSEIYTFDLSSTHKIVSFASACFIALLCILCLLLATILTFCKPGIKEAYRQRNKWFKLSVFDEFYAGIKESRFKKLYTPLLLLRRIVFVTWLVFSRSFTNIFITLGMFSAQILYMVSLLKLRPYKDAKDNLIECINEVFYTVLISILLYFNSASRWTNFVSKMYVWILMANNIVLFLVIWSKTISSSNTKE